MSNLRGMVATSFSPVETGIRYQAFYTSFHKSGLFVGWCFTNSSFTIFHRFSMGFKSCDCEGQSNTYTFSFSNHLRVFNAVCLGSLSYMKIGIVPMFQFKVDLASFLWRIHLKSLSMKLSSLSKFHQYRSKYNVVKINLDDIAYNTVILILHYGWQKEVQRKQKI